MLSSTHGFSLLLRFCVLLSLWLAALGGYAQGSPYQLTKAREIPLLGVGIAGTVGSMLLKEEREPLTLQELNALRASDILAIDRSVNNFSGSARVASDVLVASSFAAPLILLTFEESRADAGTWGVMLLETVLLNEALTGMTKALVTRPRPFTYNETLSSEERTTDDNTFSFFSGHTSHSAALAFFTARVISVYVDRPAVRTVAWTVAALLPAATGWMRYEAGKHFPTDVVVGYAVGASVGLLIPYLHRSRKRSSSERAFRVVPYGLGIAAVF